MAKTVVVIKDYLQLPRFAATDKMWWQGLSRILEGLRYVQEAAETVSNLLYSVFCLQCVIQCYFDGQYEKLCYCPLHGM